MALRNRPTDDTPAPTPAPVIGDVVEPAAVAVREPDDSRQIVTTSATPAEILRFVRGEHVQSDPMEARLSIAMQAFAAQSLDELTARRKPVMSRDYLETLFRPTSPDAIRWHKSTFDQPEESDDTGTVGFWATIDAVTADGEPVLLGTSSGDAMLKFYVASLNHDNARSRDDAAGMAKWDISMRTWRFVKADKPTARGFYPVFIELVS